MKWIFRVGISADPVTLARNLTILCTVAFSATVLYVIYSNSKKPQCTHVSFLDEELSDEDQATQCRQSSPTGSDTPEVQIQPSYCMVSDPIATDNVDMPTDVRQDENSNFKSYEIDEAETQTTTADYVLNSSSGVCGIDNAETQTMPSIMESVLNASNGVSMAAEAFVGGTLSSIESLFQPPSNIASAATIYESSYTQTLPSTTSSPLGPDIIAAGSMDDTCLYSSLTKDLDSSRAKEGFLRHFKEDKLLVGNWGELNLIPSDSMEEKGDHGSHFEGYIYGIIRDKGSKHCCLCVRVPISERSDGGCSGERIDLEGNVRFKEACTQVEGGVEVCENISLEKPHKIVGNRRKDFVSSIDGGVNTLGECRFRHRIACSQTEVRNKDRSISASNSREANVGRLLRQLPTTTQDKTRYLLRNNFECRDMGSGKFVDSLSASSTREPYSRRFLKQLPTMAKEETRHLLSNNFEKCRDNGTTTSVFTLPSSGIRAAWTGRPSKQTPKEETCHSIDNRLGVVERCAEERSEGGITSAQRDPPEKTKSPLKTQITETHHWSKMSRPEQYERLGFLDSTLAAAFEHQNGREKRNVTYWRNKDSAPHSNFSVSSALCKPQGSTECLNVDRAHSHLQEDANCTSSISRQIEQFCAEVSCLEAQQILQQKQASRALSRHPQGNHQPTSVSTACNSLSHTPPRITQNCLHDESNHRTNISAETQRLDSEAAGETQTYSKLLARNSRYPYM